MGYRSKVVLAINPVVYANAPESVKYAIAEMFDAPIEETTDRILFRADWVKWYPEYPEVKAITEWFNTIYETDYGFIELGEDLEDNNFSGSYHDFGLAVSRSISY